MNTTSKKPTSDLEGLEKALASALVPVAPRPDFVLQLQKQLQSPPAEPSAIDRLRMKNISWDHTLIGLAGIFSALMVVAAGFRTAAAILGAIGLISELNKRVKTDEDPTPTSSAA